MPTKVKWLQWGSEAFEKAQAEDKPILLDIGATWCHWCHVMNKTTYADPAVVEVIDEQYIPVQVDTDARPEINSRYNRGGWPTTAFLTPDGDLMGGGTYIPPAQMRRTLIDYSRFYHDNKDQIRRKLTETRERERAEEIDTEAIDEGGVDNRVVEQAIAEINSHADFQHGGFGRAPKFPHPEPIALALLWYHTRNDAKMLDFAKVTLDSMAAGGIHDHVGGGFHRYAVDRNWLVPHFEKLLDVNAALLSSYIAGCRALGDEAYRETAEGIMRFMESVLSGPGGCFYSSQDADAGPGDDGGYFTWTLNEVKSALPQDQARAVIALYGMTPTGNMESMPGRNVLHRAISCENVAEKLSLPVEEVKEMLLRAKARLVEIRTGRTAPKVDEKIMTNWNSLAAQAYFDAYEAFGNDDHRRRALSIVDFLAQNALGLDGAACHYIENGECHAHGLLADQTSLADASLDAYEATGDRKYMHQALEIVNFIGRHLASPAGGYFDTPETGKDYGELAVRTRMIHDNAEAARVLARLHMLTGEEIYQDQARIALAAMLPKFAGMGYLATGFALGADLVVNYPVEFVTIGPRDAPETRALHEASLRLYEPRRVVQLLDPEGDRDLIEKKGYSVPGKPALFMCVNATCGPPIHTPEQLKEAYEHFVTKVGVGA